MFDASGNLYVALLSGSQNLLKFDRSGQLVGRFNLPGSNVGLSIDLASDQCTMYYTTTLGDVLRYDVCNDRPLAPVTLLPDAPAVAIRVLPNGNLLVANSRSVLRLDQDGRILQRYDVSGADEWQSLGLGIDGQSFWAGSGAGFYKFDLVSGGVLAGPVIVDNEVQGPIEIRGIAVDGARRAASAVFAIPTLSEWGLLALAVALAGITILKLR